MPPTHPCWPAQSLRRLREVGYPRRLAGPASFEDWRCSCLYSELIPSITERSTLFVKELSFPQMAPTDDAFFNRNWAGACWNRWVGTETAVGPVRWLLMLRPPAKTRNKRGIGEGSPAVTPMPKLVFSWREKINCLEGECSTYLSPMGWPGIYSICFPNWMMMRILSH